MDEKDNFLEKSKIEVVKLLYQQIHYALWAESFAAICLTIVLWPQFSFYLLLSWLLFNLIFCGLARHILLLHFNKYISHSELTLQSANRWLRLFILGAFLSGISWGVAGSFLMVQNDLIRQTFTILVLMGVTAAANSLYSPNMRVYLYFLLPAFLPLSAYLFLQGNIYILLGILACIYIFLMLAISFHTQTLITNSLLLRFKNIGLLEDLFYQAHFDALTGLPNRTLAVDRITQAISFAENLHLDVAVFFIDIDRFKLINDTLGHSSADKLLQMVSKRLSQCVRANDTVSRSGGDEFLILLPALRSENEIISIARRCLEDINMTFLVEEHAFNISISIGISIYPKDGSNAEALIRNADIAMYKAKELGRNNFQFYTEAMNQKVLARIQLENELRMALKNPEQFSIVYQPIVSLKTGKINSVEALLRWQHPTMGFIKPEIFIPIAEESGLIIPLSKFVLLNACKQTKSWHQLGIEHMQISVNLSTVQFKQANFFDEVKLILNQTNLPSEFLILELTESILIDNSEKNLKVLRQMKQLGIQIVIDDFGVGYSSLNYLKQLPVDKLKIDRSFIKDVLLHQEDAAITSAIIALANNLGLKVIAEGIEKEEQLEFLIKHHCDEVQGFYFSKPLSAIDCEKLFEKNLLPHLIIHHD